MLKISNVQQKVSIAQLPPKSKNVDEMQRNISELKLEIEKWKQKVSGRSESSACNMGQQFSGGRYPMQPMQNHVPLTNSGRKFVAEK